MELLLFLPLAYYFFGVCYTYEVYKDLEWLDLTTSPKQTLFAVVLYPMFWIFFYTKPRIKKLKEWYMIKKSHRTNTIIK